ncbi:YcaO-like family protein, partial [Bacillus sp. SIMBA_069]
SVEMAELQPLCGTARQSFPASLVYAPYTPPQGCSALTPSSTTGAAVGKTVAEATVQAVLELIERDSFWYYSRHGGVLP